MDNPEILIHLLGNLRNGEINYILISVYKWGGKYFISEIVFHSSSFCHLGTGCGILSKYLSPSKES